MISNYPKFWMPSLIPSCVAIRNRRCDGHAKVQDSLPMNSIGKVMKSVRLGCVCCSMKWNTVFKPIKKRVKGKIIPTEMINFCLSTIMGSDFFIPVNRSSRLTRKRRKTSAISAIKAANTVRKNRRSKRT